MDAEVMSTGSSNTRFVLKKQSNALRPFWVPDGNYLLEQVTIATGFHSTEQMNQSNSAAHEKPESFKGWGSVKSQNQKMYCWKELKIRISR